MQCSEEKCLCPSACSILGECVMGHGVVKDYVEGFRLMLLETPDHKRIKIIRRVFEALKPYKVSQYKIDRFWGLRMWDGIDMDKPNAPEKSLKRQAKYKDGAIKKKTKAVIEMLTNGVWEQSRLDKIEENYTRKKKFQKILPVKSQISILNGYEPKKKNKSDKTISVSEYNAWAEKNNKIVDEHNKNIPTETWVEKKIKQYNISDTPNQMQKDILEYQIYLQGQTPEQFQLAKQHGWKIAKMLTSPEPNFHEDQQMLPELIGSSRKA